MNTQLETHQVRKSLRYSVMDAASYSVMLGLTQNYISPLALELNASTTQIGLLSSIPSLAMSVSQLSAPYLSTRAGSRKGFILPMVLMHALMFIPILLVPFVFHISPVWWLIAFVTAGVTFGAIANPAWGSMMADLVPMRLRGRYFGFRGQVAGFITQVFSYAAAGILLLFSSNIFIGYAILFGSATLFRILSGVFISKQYEPLPIVSRKKSRSLLQIIKSISSTNLGKFMLFFALIDFCTMLSGPFFTVFMFRDLNFNYLYYCIVSSSSQLAVLVFLPFWGRRADKWGNLKVVRLTTGLIWLMPIFWVFSDNIIYLVCANIISGFVWSGFSLSGINFTYDASVPQERTRQLAVFGAMDGLACCLGATIGGVIAPHLPPLLGYPLRTLFVISGVLRAVVVVFLLRQIKEVRNVSEISSWQLLTGHSGEEEKPKGKFTFRKKDDDD
ncbi:MAG: MFS transporter [Dehalococcoidales bacterium]|nr:MFS transporter [Dehalococcoidales bacterium]